jgi:hypothetical protein
MLLDIINFVKSFFKKPKDDKELEFLKTVNKAYECIIDCQTASLKRNPNAKAVSALARELNFHWRYIKNNGPYIKNGPKKGYGSFEDFCSRRNYCLQLIAFYQRWNMLTYRTEGALKDWVHTWEFIDKVKQNES